jgi:hypothetical protein
MDGGVSMSDERVARSVDRRELALLLLKWEKAKEHIDALEGEIRDLVLMTGETQTVGYVRATYSKGRITYDYERACREREADMNPALVAQHAKVTVDWRAMALESLGLAQADIPVAKMGEPSVSIGLVK